MSLRPAHGQPAPARPRPQESAAHRGRLRPPALRLKAWLLLLTAALLTPAAAACLLDGDSGPDRPESINPVIVNSELTVGENRFILGLLDQDEVEVTGASVNMRFIKLEGGGGGELRGELAATPITLEKSYTHVHEDGTVESHSAGETGVYIAHFSFDEAGEWAVEVRATIEDFAYSPTTLPMEVSESSSSVAVGEEAPRSETPTVDDVAAVSEIDTSYPPVPEMHQMTIAEAVTSGRPSVIVFATPAFCLTRLCGPAKETVDDLFEEYGDRVNFVHVEPYDVERARAGEGLFTVEATREWGLISEPWVFLVSADGTVAAKFESIFTLEELRQALEPLLVA